MYDYCFIIALLQLGMGVRMDKVYSLENIKKEIERRQQELNELIISEINKNKILQFSMELDNVINLYYNLSMHVQ